MNLRVAKGLSVALRQHVASIGKRLARSQALTPVRWRDFHGPQNGQGRAQACPSKHPDGYIEALFWLA
jgi:hypothetical protein